MHDAGRSLRVLEVTDSDIKVIPVDTPHDMPIFVALGRIRHCPQEVPEGEAWPQTKKRTPLLSASPEEHGQSDRNLRRVSLKKDRTLVFGIDVSDHAVRGRPEFRARTCNGWYEQLLCPDGVWNMFMCYCCIRMCHVQCCHIMYLYAW